MSKVTAIKEIIRQGYLGKFNQQSIANSLNDAGHTTHTGQPWTAPAVSYFARVTMGLRKKKPFKKSRGPKQLKMSFRKRAPEAEANGSTLMTDIEDVMTTNMPDRLKLIAVKAVLGLKDGEE